MEEIFYILVGLVLVLALPVFAISAFVMAVSARGRLDQLEADRDRLKSIANQFSDRLARLERGGAFPSPDAMPAPIPVTALVAEPVPEPAVFVDTPPPPPRGLPTNLPPPHPPRAPISEAWNQTTQPSVSLEESIGTRWTVWVGGLALALGGVFLVKYSIEQGFFGPAARIAMAALFSFALLAAGEWLRRRDSGMTASSLPSAHIPAILTAAGVVCSFATGYGAYALYHFLEAGSAFILLGAIAVAAMVVSLLHGPWVAVLGVLGAYGTPLLIDSDEPNRAALAIYLVAVTFAAFVIARFKLWRWVASTALILALGWGVAFSLLINEVGGNRIEFGGYLLALLVLTIGLLVAGLDEALSPPEDRTPNWLGVLALAGLAVLGFFLLQLDNYGLVSRAVAAVFVLGAIGVSWRYPAMALTVLIGGIFAFVSVLSWTIDIQANLDNGILVQGVDGLNQIRPKLIGEFAGLAALLALVFGTVGAAGAFRATPQADRTAACFAGAGAFTPVLILVAAWLRIDGWASSPLFAALALVLVAVNGAATSILLQREDRTAPSTAVAIQAVGTLAALAAGFTIALDRGALTIALALMVPALAWVHGLRPIPVLKPLAAIMGCVVLARFVWDPRIVGTDLGATPIFNWLLYGYGIPALGLGYAAHRFRRAGASQDDLSVGILEALATLFTALLCLLEIRHFVHHGDVFTRQTDLVELGSIATLLFIGVGALTRLGAQVRSPVYSAAGLVVLMLSVLTTVGGLFFRENPALNVSGIEPSLFINALLIGYLVPAIAAFVAAWLIRPAAHPAQSTILSAIGIMLGLTYVTLMVRHWYQGANLIMLSFWRGFMPATSDAEYWTYSVVWLLYGIVMLVIGVVGRSPTARIASAIIIALTVLKAFLFDMSALTGIFRALSFIGLGVVLIAIGWLYQKLLFVGSARNKPRDDAGNG